MAAYKDEERGTWYVSFYYEDWTGAKKRKVKRGFRTKKEALNFESEYKRTAKADMDMTMGEFVEVYFRDKAQSLKDRSIKNKRDTMNAQLLPYFKDRPMNSITPAEIIQWQNTIIEKGYSDDYLKTIQNQMTALFNHAKNIYNLADNPCDKVKRMGKTSKKKMKFWTIEEYRQFMTGIEPGSKYYVLFELLFWTGAREGEALSITPADIDFERNLLHINKTYYRMHGKDVITSPKTEESNRTISIPEFLKKEIQDYGYDEQLQYYIYPNGQCQESSRDQAHVLAGLHNYVAIAEMAWNQGDSLYSSLNNRLLLGLEWNYRYNLSEIQSYEDQRIPWEPTGVTKDINEVTFDNGKYLQIKSRSGRWESVNISSHGRGDVSGTGGTREMALAHYAVRAGLPENNYTWLKRYRDYMIEHHGCENWGIAPNWFYEWTGWGTLTKRLTPWMAGDPVSFSTGKRVSGIHLLPCEISAADYDYYCLAEDPEGHTYHNVGKKRGNEYRPDGAVELRKEEDNYVVTQIEDGEWMNYTVSIPTDGDYTVYLVYQSKGNSLLSVASDSEVKTEPMQLPSSIQWTEREIGKLTLPAGACVLRLQIEQAGDKLEIQKIIVK